VYGSKAHEPHTPKIRIEPPANVDRFQTDPS
jgi:hypothetical protein